MGRGRWTRAVPLPASQTKHRARPGSRLRSRHRDAPEGDRFCARRAIPTTPGSGALRAAQYGRLRIRLRRLQRDSDNRQEIFATDTVGAVTDPDCPVSVATKRHGRPHPADTAALDTPLAGERWRRGLRSALSEQKKTAAVAVESVGKPLCGFVQGAVGSLLSIAPALSTASGASPTTSGSAAPPASPPHPPSHPNCCHGHHESRASTEGFRLLRDVRRRPLCAARCLDGHRLALLRKPRGHRLRLPGIYTTSLDLWTLSI